MHETHAHIASHAQALRDEVVPSDEAGRLSDAAVEILQASGGMRLLQAKDLGGFEEHPNEFFDWVTRVGTEHPSAGWIAGVVGVHPWEISIMHPAVQEEIYGSDPDVLTASPYAPFGRAVPVEDQASPSAISATSSQRSSAASFSSRFFSILAISAAKRLIPAWL